jgi:ABC-type antimicrobial peptide transport system permease subunit
VSDLRKSYHLGKDSIPVLQGLSLNIAPGEMVAIMVPSGSGKTTLIQVRARHREFAVLKSIGISRGQVAQILLIEGTIIGCVSAALSIIIGNGLGASNIRFLYHFTQFDYFLRISLPAWLHISAFCTLTCVIASIYLAFIANRASSTGSLHYV